MASWKHLVMFQSPLFQYHAYLQASGSNLPCSSTALYLLNNYFHCSTVNSVLNCKPLQSYIPPADTHLSMFIRKQTIITFIFSLCRMYTQIGSVFAFTLFSSLRPFFTSHVTKILKWLLLSHNATLQQFSMIFQVILQESLSTCLILILLNFLSAHIFTCWIDSIVWAI